MSLLEASPSIQTFSTQQLGHVVLCVENLEIAVQFYTQAFGAVRNGKGQAGYEELVLGERVLALVSPALWEQYVGVPVAPASSAKAKETVANRGLLLSLEVKPRLAPVWLNALELGATELKPPHEMPWQTISGFLLDPYGVVWELTAPIEEKKASA
jgi:uncharacterized glyoxalase superfamily protein PhnB